MVWERRRFWFDCSMVLALFVQVGKKEEEKKEEKS